MNKSGVLNLAKAVDTTAICDADKTIRVMGPEIRPRSLQSFVCGPAFTVRSRGDFLPVAFAVEAASPGDVIVVDGGGECIALAGELFARAAEARGLAGIIVDAGYRDMGYVHSARFPVFSRYVTPMAGSTVRIGDSGITVTCGGVSVAPGDIIVGDREGIVVLDPSQAVRVLRAAADVKAVEARVVALLDAGSRLKDCLNLEEHRELLSQGKLSALRFTV